ncbi:MAG: type I-U CRISPR-associated protein Csx17 [Gammaproteobacteria bacterium]|nr:type I-U CRISPR-associated protein Csx17 [Gammaproteobacteria bacterium]
MTTRQRLEALETLTDTSRHFAQMRRAGEFHYGDQAMHEPSAIAPKVGEPDTDYVLASDAGRCRVHLHGCTPTPLASYLKALAILRLVAEQKDAEARGWWEGEHFVLESMLDEEGLKEFFLAEYRPTPIIAPWNGGSGFYPNDNKDGISALEKSDDSRFQDYLESISIGRLGVKSMGLSESPKDKVVKSNFLILLRSQLPDEALAWMDAALMLTSDDVRFPPLLGTGGNDGRLDFTNNFMQRLNDVFDLSSNNDEQASNAWLDESIYRNPQPFLTSKKAIGQFSPGQSGGPNAGTGYEAESLINPWDFIFMIEGALLFAAAATRRLGSEEQGALTFPFTVRPKGSGQGGLSMRDEAPARAEIWLPLWERPTSLMALKGLFSEGRVTLGRRSVKDGLDFARAISLLAVNRGINSFQRYAFMMRSGKAYLATPLTRFRVPREPQQDLISELDHWLWRFQAWARGDNTPNRVKSLAQRLDNALFDLTRQGGDKHDTVQKTLILLGEIQRYAGTSPATQEKVPPVPVLSERWFAAARDNSIEFRIAAALAGLQGVKEHPLPMRVHLSPLDPKEEKYPAWLLEGKKHQYRTWHHGGLEKNLLAVLEKRLLLAQKDGFGDKPLGGWPGADLASIATFLAGETNDNRITQLVAGLAHCRSPRHIEWEPVENSFAIPATFTLLKLVMTPNRQLRRCGLLTENEYLPIPVGLVRRLAAGRIDDAVRLAQRRLRIAGISPLPGSPGSAGLTGSRLAAALLIPLSDVSVRDLYRSISQQNNKQAS